MLMNIIKGPFIGTIIHLFHLVGQGALLKNNHQMFGRLKELEDIRSNTFWKLDWIDSNTFCNKETRPCTLLGKELKSASLLTPCRARQIHFHRAVYMFSLLQTLKRRCWKKRKKYFADSHKRRRPHILQGQFCHWWFGRYDLGHHKETDYFSVCIY